MLTCEDSDHVRTDLVCGVAISSDAIGADDHAIDLALLHNVTGHVVGNHRDRNVVLGQFPCGQTSALQKRPRLVGDDGDSLAGIDRSANNAEGRAVIPGGRQGARVAVRQHRRAVGNQLAAELAQRPIRLRCLH